MIITKLTNQSHLKFQNYSKAIKAYLSNYFRIANGYCCKNYTNKLIVKKMYCISNNKRKIRKKLCRYIKSRSMCFRYNNKKSAKLDL